MNRLNALISPLAAGYVLMFYSEFVFYGQCSEPGQPAPNLPDTLLMYLVYVLMAYLILSVLHYFQVRSYPSLFITGAVYGWLLEGAVVSTVYENLPFSISFTGLAWHAPIDILLGWYLVRKSLIKFTPWRAASLFGLMGLVWGTWVLWPWYEMGDPIPLEGFVLFSFGTVFLLMVAYWLLGKRPIEDFKPSPFGVITIALLLLMSYLLNVLTNDPLTGLLLFPLLGICWWALGRERVQRPKKSALIPPAGEARWMNLILLLIFPFSASLTYALFQAANLKLPSNIFLGLPASLLGPILFLLSLWRIYKRTDHLPSLESPSP